MDNIRGIFCSQKLRSDGVVVAILQGSICSSECGESVASVRAVAAYAVLGHYSPSRKDLAIA